MHDYDDLTRRLADLVVGFGANVQPGQLVGVTSYLGKEELTREIARAAYERGASFVDVLYFDQLLKRERLLGGDPETFSYIPPWMVDRLRYLSDERAARISLSGPQAPHALDDVPADRSGADLAAVPARGRPRREPAHDELVRRAGADAGLGRARLSRIDEPAEAFDRLWGAIAHVCRLDEADPVAAWETRMGELNRGAATLSERRFDAIHLHGPGTDLTLGLFQSSVWEAAEFDDGRRDRALPEPADRGGLHDARSAPGGRARDRHDAARALRHDHPRAAGRVRRRAG